MQNYEQLSEQIEKRTKTLEEAQEVLDETVKSFRRDMTKLLEEAKENEILKALSAMERRLAAIEARLPEPEEEAT